MHAQVWDAQYSGMDLLQSAVAQSSNGKGPLAQFRCTGFGGGIKAVKVRCPPNMLSPIGQEARELSLCCLGLRSKWWQECRWTAPGVCWQGMKSESEEKAFHIEHEEMDFSKLEGET
jgi:hypothetical protein